MEFSLLIALHKAAGAAAPSCCGEDCSVESSLPTCVGAFKMSLRRRGRSVIVLTTLASPTLNGSEQFPWILPNVSISLEFSSGVTYKSHWSFTNLAKTSILECRDCLSRGTSAVTLLNETVLARIQLAEGRYWLFLPSENGLIHTPANYKNFHRSVLHLLTSGALESEACARIEDAHLLNLLRSIARLASSSSFHQLLMYLADADQLLLEGGVAEILEGLCRRIFKRHETELVVVDWEGDVSNIAAMIVNTQKKPRAVALRLSIDSGVIKTMPKRAVHSLPLTLQADSVLYQCSSITLMHGKHEVSLYRLGPEHWARVSDHGYEVCNLDQAALNWHVRLLPVLVLYRPETSAERQASPLETQMRLRFTARHPIVSGQTPSGGLALASGWPPAGRPAGGPPAGPAAELDLPQRPGGAGATARRRSRSYSSSRPSTDTGECTSACSDHSADRNIRWIRLASRLWQHLGFAGVLWADLQIPSSRFAAAAPAAAKTKSSKSAELKTKRKAKCDATGRSQKRRRLPADAWHRTGALGSSSFGPRARASEFAGGGPAKLTDSDARARASSRWYVYRSILQYLLVTHFAAGGAEVRLSFDHDPTFVYEIQVDLAALKNGNFAAELHALLRQCQQELNDDDDDASGAWTPWGSADRQGVSLWTRHGVTWRQLIAANKTAACSFSHRPVELLALLYDSGQRPGQFETLLSVYSLADFTYRPIHTGYVTSLSAITIEDLWKKQVRPRNACMRDGSRTAAVVQPFVCTLQDGQRVFSSWSVRRLRLVQGAFVFHTALPVTHVHTLPRISVLKATPAPAPPALPLTAKTRAEPPKSPNVEIATRALEKMFRSFCMGQARSAADIDILCALMRAQREQALRCLSQVTKLDQPTCNLMRRCSDVIVSTAARRQPTGQRSCVNARRQDRNTSAHVLVSRLTSALLGAANSADLQMCESCIDVLNVLHDEGVANVDFLRHF